MLMYNSTEKRGLSDVWVRQLLLVFISRFLCYACVSTWHTQENLKRGSEEKQRWRSAFFYAHVEAELEAWVVEEEGED